MRRWEATAYRPFERVVLVTDEDAREVARLDPSLRVVTIPNGVDAAHFAPPPVRERSGIVFTGALDAPSNAQAAMRLAQRIMPLVRRELPDATLTIVGRSPGPEVRALGRRSSPTSPTCGRTCGAPPSTRARWRAAPGSRTSCWRRWRRARRRSRRRSPARGSTRCARARSPTPTRPSPPALVALLRDRARAAALADGAREYVRARHDWDAVAAAYLALYEAHRCERRARARPPRPSVVSGGLWTLLNRVLPQAQLLVLSIIVARYLGPTDMGRQSYIAFVAIALVQVATAGMPIALIRVHRRAARRAPRRARDVAVPVHAPGRARRPRRSWSLSLVVVALAGGDPRAAWVLAGLSAALAVLQAVPMSLLAGAQRWREGSVPGLVTGVATVPLTIVVLEPAAASPGCSALEAAAVFANLRLDVRAGAPARARSCRAAEPVPPELRRRFLVLRGLDLDHRDHPVRRLAALGAVRAPALLDRRADRVLLDRLRRDLRALEAARDGRGGEHAGGREPRRHRRGRAHPARLLARDAAARAGDAAARGGRRGHGSGAADAGLRRGLRGRRARSCW